jgi:hypothetical protein
MVERRENYQISYGNDNWERDVTPLIQWPEERMSRAVEYLKTQTTDPLSLFEEKLKGSTRLIVFGVGPKPLDISLIDKLLVLPQVGFVGIDERAPGDKARALPAESMVQIELGDGVVVEMSASEAQKKFPQHVQRDPNKPIHFYDPIVGRARLKGKDVLYTLSGDSYEEAVNNTTKTVTDYLTRNPNSKGIIFTTVLKSLKWPGGKEERLREVHDPIRPFVDAYTMLNPEWNDPRIPMPAYNLASRFPHQVYSVAEFAMPEGYYSQWKNFRTAVDRAQLKQPSALDNIAASPFTEDWVLERDFDSEIAKRLQWGELLDGVVIYPSDVPVEPEKKIKSLLTNPEIVAQALNKIAE